MDNLTARIGNDRMAILGAERFALLLLRSIRLEQELGTPMNAHEIEMSIREGAATLREHHDGLFGEGNSR